MMKWNLTQNSQCEIKKDDESEKQTKIANFILWENYRRDENRQQYHGNGFKYDYAFQSKHLNGAHAIPDFKTSVSTLPKL